MTRKINERIDAFPGRGLADLRGLRREYSRRLCDAEPQFILRLASGLQDAKAVHRFFSDELIANHTGTMGGLTCRDLDIIGDGMNSWDQVDCFATIVAGTAWRAGRITDADVAWWARSNDRWWRRASLVSTTRLNIRGTTGHTRRTLAVCRMLIEDHDDMVVKAMSWALRALSKLDPKSVAAFIERNHGRLAPRVVREVGNKLRTGLKNPRRTRSQ